MKLSKLLAGFVAAATAVTALSAAASAYKFVTEDPFEGTKDGVDLGMSWAWTGVPAEEFTDLTADTVVKLTFTVDDADLEGKNYWIIKPIVSDSFIDPDNTVNPDLPLGDDKAAFTVTTDQTTLSFKIAPSLIDAVKSEGLGFVGHRVTLMTLELINDAPPATDDNNTGDATTADGNNNGGNDGPKDPANTGIEGVAVLMGVGVLAGAAVVISKKRK